MVRSHRQTQGARHYAGRGLEEAIVQELEEMLEDHNLDEIFQVAGKQRGRKNKEMLFHAHLLPGATVRMPLRPDFGIKHIGTGRFAAFGGAKKSLRERAVQDLVIAQKIKEIYSDSFWFECTVKESAKSTSAHIERKLATVSAVYGNAWDAFCSIAFPDSMIIMKAKLVAHLKAWNPQARAP